MAAPTSIGPGGRASWAACSGCGVCALACPVWDETRDVMMTPHGVCKSLQGGVGLPEVADSVLACVMCGACRAVCPEQIDTIELARQLRAELVAAHLSPFAGKADACETAPTGRSTITARRVFLPGPLAGHSRRLDVVCGHLRRQGGIVVGPDLTAAARRWEAGLPDAVRSLDRGLARVPRASTFIVADGITQQMLRDRLPKARVTGLGETLLRAEALRRCLSPTDLYVIEPSGYHADHERLAPFYDGLRRETGCQLNLDLQRLAISTGRGLQDDLGIPNLDWRTRIDGMLRGRTVSRVIVESVGDIAPLAARTRVPVVHLAELLT